MQLAPKTVSALTEYSPRMLINAVPAVEQSVRRDLVTILATAIDDKAIAGDGTGSTPTGILNITGIGSADLSNSDGGAPTWDRVLATVEETALDDALDGDLGWLTMPAVIEKMRGTVRVASTNSRMIMDGARTLTDYPLAVTTQFPANLTKGAGTKLTALFLGNFADLLIGYWSAVDIMAPP